MRYSLRSASEFAVHCRSILVAPDTATNCGAAGLDPSITNRFVPLSESPLPGAGRVSDALFPAGSAMVAPASASEFVPTTSNQVPVPVTSPGRTVYLNLKAVVPDPDR